MNESNTQKGPEETELANDSVVTNRATLSHLNSAQDFLDESSLSGPSATVGLGD